MKFKIDGLGTLTIRKNKKATSLYGMGLRKSYDFIAVLEDGTKVKSYGDTPNDWSWNQVFSLACDAIGTEVAEITGDDTGNNWTLLASSVEYGEDSAAEYATTPIHYSTIPYSLRGPHGITFRTKAEIRDEIRNQYRFGLIDKGHGTYVYTNNADEPDGRYTIGPRGGLIWEGYGSAKTYYS